MKVIVCLLIFISPLVLTGQDSSLNATDVFESFDSTTSLNGTGTSQSINNPGDGHKQNGIYWTAVVLGLSVVAGVMVRFKSTRRLRSLFLVLSLLIFGFYRGACPCSVQSIQNGILFIAGVPVNFHSILLFAGLILVTYFFGRIYCGWICHLGALQEFIHTTAAIKILQSNRAQTAMRIIRIIVLALLVLQLLVTKTNLYKKVDPFSTLFNFSFGGWLDWVLVSILVAISFLMYRPFCKTLCPVGLVLGWVSKIPGASVLGVNNDCIGCVKCSNHCAINAITHDERYSMLNNQECIRCGECLNNCVKNAVKFKFHSMHEPAELELAGQKAGSKQAIL